MASTLLRWPAVLLTALLIASCGLAARPRTEFEPVFKSYVERLRWRDYQTVAGYLPEAERRDFLQRFSDMDELHIVDVKLDSAEFSEDGKRVLTAITVEYYRIPSIAVKKTRLHQEWTYQGGDRYHPGSWGLAGPFPPFP